MQDLDLFHDLLESIYSSTLDEELWPVFLEKLARITHSVDAIFWCKNKSGEMRFLHYYNSSPEEKKVPEEYHIHLLPYVLSMQNESVERHNSSKFGKKYAGGVIYNRDGITLYIVITKLIEDEDYTKDDIKLLEYLYPHLRRAFIINHRLSKHKTRQFLTEQVLDSAKMAIILVDQAGELLLFNKQAKLIFESDNDISVKNGKLVISNRKDNDILLDLISDTTRSGLKRGGLKLECATSTSLTLLVTPIESTHLKPLAIVSIMEDKNEIELCPNFLKTRYRLTRTETRLVQALVNHGATIETVAKKFQVSEHTIRVHTKSIFKKTKVNRQADLVKLLLSGPVRVFSA